MANDLDLRVRLLGDSSDLDAATRDGEESVSRLTTVMAGLGVAGAAGGAALSVGFARALDLEEGRARLQAQLGITERQQDDRHEIDDPDEAPELLARAQPPAQAQHRGLAVDLALSAADLAAIK